MKIRAVLVGAGVALAVASGASAQNLSEGFESVAALPGQGWAFQNNSSPLGTTDWFQGNANVFNAHAGTPSSYLGANFNNTAGVGTISNWAMAPARVWNNGDMVSFYTRTVSMPTFPDRLEVRLSTNGASTDVGVNATSVGDFSLLLTSVNPALVPGGYPSDWTQVQLTISGLGGPVLGRLAFRYFVEFGGPNGINSDYIGIDSLDIRGINVIPLPTAGAMGLAGLGFIATRRRRQD